MGVSLAVRWKQVCFGVGERGKFPSRFFFSVRFFFDSSKGRQWGHFFLVCSRFNAFCCIQVGWIFWVQVGWLKWNLPKRWYFLKQNPGEVKQKSCKFQKVGSWTFKGLKWKHKKEQNRFLFLELSSWKRTVFVFLFFVSSHKVFVFFTPRFILYTDPKNHQRIPMFPPVFFGKLSGGKG